MIGNDILKQLSARLKPCQRCGGEAILTVSRPTLGETSSHCYDLYITCSRCKRDVRANIKSDIDAMDVIYDAICVWNDLNISDIPSESSDIDKKLAGFDEDQKTLVCIMLHIAGYSLPPEVLSKYVQHNTINLKETFDSMSKEQKTKMFFIIGRALEYYGSTKDSEENK